MQFDVIGINPEGIAVQETQAAIAEAQSAGAEEISENTENGSDEVETLPLQASMADWVLAVTVSIFVSLFAYQLGSTSVNVRWGVRWALWVFIGGMTSIGYLALGLPGSAALLEAWEVWGVVFATLLGTGIGWLITWVWRARSSKVS